MKLTTFKKELKKTGVSYTLVKGAHDSTYYDSEVTLEKLISVCGKFKRVILKMCHWHSSKRGYTFWHDVSIGHKPLIITAIAKHGEILSDFGITKSGNNWIIGCQSISKAKRLKMFKLLAKDLDYELEG